MMSGWDIQPQGVQGQLQLTGTRAGSLQKALTAMGTNLQHAAQAAGTALPGSAAKVPVYGPVVPGQTRNSVGPVAAALSQYMEKRGKDFESMAKRIEAAVLGAAKATNEYVEGDLQAAREAQNAARQVRLDLLKDAGGKS